jgi:hypothetical protein
MANPFEVTPANPLAALMSGVAGYDRAQKATKEADVMAARQAGMTALQQGGDPRNALAQLLSVGDVQGAQAIAQYAEHEANRAFRQQESARNQSNQDRSFGLQQQQFALTRQQAEAAARGVDYKEVDDGNGGKVLVRIHKANNTVERVPIAGGQEGEGPANPYAPAGKQTDDQAKAALYARRMFQAERILRDPAVVAAATSIKEQAAGEIGNRLPLGMGRGVMSEAFQRYDQAKRDFVNAVLRRESGAVISEAEFANAEKQYFPAPNDDPKTLRQKQQNREEAIRGITGAAGRAHTPEYVFGNDGQIVPNPRVRGGNSATPQRPAMPKVGEVRDGYRFLGGDPASPESWQALSLK